MNDNLKTDCLLLGTPNPRSIETRTVFTFSLNNGPLLTLSQHQTFRMVLLVRRDLELILFWFAYSQFAVIFNCIPKARFLFWCKYYCNMILWHSINDNTTLLYLNFDWKIFTCFKFEINCRFVRCSSNIIWSRSKLK